MPDFGYLETLWDKGWPVIRGAPIQFVFSLLFLAVCAWLLARWEFSLRLENAKESRNHYKDKSERLEKASKEENKQLTVESKPTELRSLLIKGQQVPEAKTEAVSPLPTADPPVNFNAVIYFRNVFHSYFTADVEKRIRIAADQNKPLMKTEDFYAQFIGVGMVAYLHDITDASRIESQSGDDACAQSKTILRSREPRFSPELYELHLRPVAMVYARSGASHSTS
jgi:hypothetical protein